MVERWSDGCVRGRDVFAHSNSTVDLRRPLINSYFTSEYRSAILSRIKGQIYGSMAVPPVFPIDF